MLKWLTTMNKSLDLIMQKCENIIKEKYVSNNRWNLELEPKVFIEIISDELINPLSELIKKAEDEIKNYHAQDNDPHELKEEMQKATKEVMERAFKRVESAYLNVSYHLYNYLLAKENKPSINTKNKAKKLSKTINEAINLIDNEHQEEMELLKQIRDNSIIYVYSEASTPPSTKNTKDWLKLFLSETLREPKGKNAIDRIFEKIDKAYT